MSLPDFDKVVAVGPEPAPKPPKPPKAPKAPKPPKSHKRKREQPRAPEPQEEKAPVSDPKKQELLFQIRQILENEVLGPILDGRLELKKMGRASVEELEDILTQIDLVLSNENNGKIVDQGIRTAMTYLEQMAQCEGTTDACFGNDHWRFLYERVKYRYGLLHAPRIDPILELSMVTFQTAAMMHRKNRLTKIQPRTDLSAKIDQKAV